MTEVVSHSRLTRINQRHLKSASTAIAGAPNNLTIKENIMLYTISVVMLILWLLGMITSNTMGGFIHILLVIAIVVVLLRVITG